MHYPSLYLLPCFLSSNFLHGQLVIVSCLSWQTIKKTQAIQALAESTSKFRVEQGKQCHPVTSSTHPPSRQHHSPESSPVISSSLPIWSWNITAELLQTCLREAFPCVGLGPGIHQAFLPSTLCISLPTSFTGHPLPFSDNNTGCMHGQTLS